MSKLSVHQRRARDFIQREDWSNALHELQRMLGADANNPTLHNQIGDVYLRKDEVGRALEHFERAIDLYAVVGLHNNAVALCKKIQRLRPGRVEIRYRLATLRLEQGFRSEAAASFREYLEHASTSRDESEQLERRCREIIDLMPDEAPIGLLLEKLEAAQRFVAAFEIVRTLAQRAAEAGDDAAAKRYGEKLRSLRVLVERSGGRDLLAEPQAPRRAQPPGAPALEATGRAHFEPRVLDLARRDVEPPTAPASPAVVAEPAPFAQPLAASLAAAAAPAAAPRFETPQSPLDEPLPELPFIGGGFEVFAPNADAPADDTPAESDNVDASLAPAPEPDVAPPLFEAPGDLRLDDDAPASAASDRDAAAFDPLAFDDEPVTAAEPESHFADLAAALGSAAIDAPPPPMQAPQPAPAAALPPTPAAAEWGAFDAAALAEPLPSSHARTAPTGFLRWVDDLRRSPVWIPSGDMLTGPDPTRPDRGLSMELESVIDSFREQMTRALDGDGQARYDLGVAYYDMGLYNEALAEFEAAASCPGLEVQSHEMLAQCLLQTGRHGEVIELLLPVVAADGHALHGALGLQYCLGLAYEGLGDFDQARRCFEEVALVDVDFKDVQSRLQRT